MIKKNSYKKMMFLLVAISVIVTTLSFTVKNNSESYVHVATIDENKGVETESGVGKVSLTIISSNNFQSLNESSNKSIGP